MLRYGLAGAIQIPWYAASRFSGSSSIASVGTHSKGSRTWSSASFVKRWVGFFGLKSPTTPIKALMSRDILPRTPGERAQPRRRLHEPARQEQNDRDEQRAEVQQVEVNQGNRRLFLGEDVEDRAQHRAVDRAEAADERDEEGVEGPVRPEGVRRVVADVVIGEEPARESGERRREHQGQELEPERADAAGLGRLFVLADRLHAESRPRALEGRHDADGRRRQRDREIQAVAQEERAGRSRRRRRAFGQSDVVTPDDERHRRKGGQRRHAEREPPATAHRAKSPRGRATSTARKMTRPTTSRYGPPNANALAASARPRTRPPTKVPSIEPSPARTTTMSAFSVHSSPMDGLIE